MGERRETERKKERQKVRERQGWERTREKIERETGCERDSENTGVGERVRIQVRERDR